MCLLWKDIFDFSSQYTYDQKFPEVIIYYIFNTPAVTLNTFKAKQNIKVFILLNFLLHAVAHCLSLLLKAGVWNLYMQMKVFHFKVIVKYVHTLLTKSKPSRKTEDKAYGRKTDLQQGRDKLPNSSLKIVSTPPPPTNFNIVLIRKWQI